jgi:hypothetical protein
MASHSETQHHFSMSKILYWTKLSVAMVSALQNEEELLPSNIGKSNPDRPTSVRPGKIVSVCH